MRNILFIFSFILSSISFLKAQVVELNPQNFEEHLIEYVLPNYEENVFDEFIEKYNEGTLTERDIQWLYEFLLGGRGSILDVGALDNALSDGRVVPLNVRQAPCDKLVEIRDAMLDECNKYPALIRDYCSGAVMIAYWIKSKDC